MPENAQIYAGTSQIQRMVMARQLLCGSCGVVLSPLDALEAP
ncbi:MAG: hypothetical protein WBH47_04735 [Streptosporangiaceae bacterium]